ncbi:MAG: amino acid ABC transporter permease [Pseudomonadota bacterium]
MDYHFDFSVVIKNWGFLLSGIGATLYVTAFSLLIGALLGLFVGLGRMSSRQWLSACAAAYVEVFRNTPALVQLIWVYYCLPILTGWNPSAINSVILALGLNASAYIAEIVRAGIQSIDRGQMEAGRSIGMSFAQTMRTVILPQAVRRMLPSFVNEAVAVLKFSSLVSVLGVADLTYQANVLSTTTFRPIEIFSSIAVVYFVLCTALATFARQLERRLARAD